MVMIAAARRLVTGDAVAEVESAARGPAREPVEDR